LGVRDPINNLLEVSSTVQSIKKDSEGNIQINAVKSENEWFSSQTEQVLCFGCKRLLIEVRGGSNDLAITQKFLDLLPDVIKVNAERTFVAETAQKAE
jgi:ribosomal protein S27E